MESTDILKKVRQIEIKTKRLSNHIFSGEYHSSFKGRGMSFAEVRPYQFGDDIRAIDWNKTAHFNEPYVKVFEEERELTFMLAVDVSGSEHFGTQKQFKRETLAEIAATLAFSAIQNNDKVGLLLFTDQIELFIPPKKGKFHVLRIIRELLQFKPQSKGTKINTATRYLSNVLKRKSIVFLLSDFQDKDYKDSLKFIARKHDLTGIHIYDLADKFLPKVGFTLMEDRETQKRKWIYTNSKRIQAQYTQYFLDRQNYFTESFTKNGAGIIELETQESYVKKLMQFFKSR